MKLEFYGAASGQVTGSCFGIQVKQSRILIDCGMFQGSKTTNKMNYADFSFNPKERDALLLTHAHLDHCGRIPKLVRDGFKGKIYSTVASRDLAYLIMTDAAKVAYHDTVRENRRRAREGKPPREPIYTQNDVDDAIKLFRAVIPNRPFKINKHFYATYYEAGHILGASSILVEAFDGSDKKLIAFSGDIGVKNPLLVKERGILPYADYVFVECTYGDRIHTPVNDRTKKITRIIKETYKKKGVLMIPVFAIERAQELLYELNNLVEQGLIPKMRVYFDSPMGIKATEIFKKHKEFFNKELQHAINKGDNPFSFPGLAYTTKVEESKAINDDKGPFIVIAGSGMCNAGRIKFHIKERISDPKNTILFVGYQAEGTLGYHITRGEKKIRLLGTEAEVNVKIERIDSYSAHAGYPGLLDWVSSFKPEPKQVFLVHGNKESLNFMKEKVESLGIKAHRAKMDEVINL